jgi:hypothetical protein
MNTFPIQTSKIFNGQAILQAGNVESVVIDLREIVHANKFALSYTLAGAGTVKLEYLVAPTRDGIFLEPAAASDIVGSISAGSGNLSWTPIVAPFMKIKATENNAGAITSLDAWLHIQ